ncbi:DUF3788 family protein [Thomasclavelia ramosa]|mgnify:FL=1|uniref:DUF3788 family protein n=1 Tax=Thomasclavelia ramosa TaxID=1547 RepID=UPI000E421E3C|nr:DUF3788 family protein [Thomasclavelia ramosa]RGC88389.1 DUF3788 domain-containing protein [Thomasclavelia ramosa]
MINIKDINYAPNISEISGYIKNPIFDEFYQYMNDKYKAVCKIEYSKDVWARGWNVKLRKAGKSLCVIYPKEQYFTLLIVVGSKEKNKVEELLPQLSKEMQDIYQNTKEGNGQRWLMIDLHKDDCLYQDALNLIHIRRESK